MNLPDLFRGLLSNFYDLFDNFLKDPNNKITAETTQTGRQVIKMETNDPITGLVKDSAVRYSTGTIVETKVYKTQK